MLAIHRPESRISRDRSGSAPVRHWRPAPSTPDLICAAFTPNGEVPHLHEEWQFAVVEQPVSLGLGAFRRHAAGAGELIVVHPREVHVEVPVGEARSWRALYLAPGLVAEAFAGLPGRAEPRSPWFVRPVIRDAALAEELLVLLRESEREMLRDDAFVARVSHWLSRVLRHAAATSSSEPPRHESPAVRLARAYLEEEYSRNVPIEQLTSVAGVSGSHLMRAFARSVGLPPLSYQAQVRLARARRLLAEGRSAGWVAHECGFADQSHLSRRFKETYGLTPGAFQRQCRGGVYGAGTALARIA